MTSLDEKQPSFELKSVAGLSETAKPERPSRPSLASSDPEHDGRAPGPHGIEIARFGTLTKTRTIKPESVYHRRSSMEFGDRKRCGVCRAGFKTLCNGLNAVIKDYFRDNRFTFLTLFVFGILAMIMYLLKLSGIVIYYKSRNVFNVSIVAICICLLYLLIRIAELIVFFFIDLLSGTVLWPLWYYLSSLKGYLAVFATAITSGLIWKTMGLPYYDEIVALESLWMCVILSVILFIIRQLALNSVFWNIESKSYQDRCEEAQFYDWSIKRLCQSLHDLKDGPSLLTFAEENVSRSHNVWNKIYLLRAEKEWILPTLLDTDAGNIANKDKFAYNLFIHIDSMSKGYLEFNDFVRFMHEKDAITIFYDFAKGAATEKDNARLDEEERDRIHISFEVFNAAFHRIKENRRMLASEIRSSNHASYFLRRVMNVVSWFFLPFLFSAVLQTDFTTLALTTTSLLVSFSFAFKTTVARFFESAYFLFVSKPFKLGDRVAIWRGSSYETCIVYDVNLMTTSLRTLDAKIIVFPNFVLASENILNYNVCPTATMKIVLQMDVRTPPEILKTFRDRVENYFVQNKTDWKPKTFSFYFDDIVEARMIQMSIWVVMRYRWQEAASVFPARSKLMEFLKDQVLDLGITVSMSPQPYIVNSSSGAMSFPPRERSFQPHH